MALDKFRLDFGNVVDISAKEWEEELRGLLDKAVQTGETQESNVFRVVVSGNHGGENSMAVYRKIGATSAEKGIY